MVQVLRVEFRMGDGQAQRIMMTADQRGVCVVAAFTREIAEEKATAATEMGRKQGYPLLFTTEPED
ncbi:ATP-dependent Clp protease adaptor ClpS [Belnapia sp. T18]|uniref:ATP-dependent Clp protease adaptor ClpS n=1 Tax=Belnapia arida TaxID=2804533 RepID=A0ABS1UCP3_9PROT|nr:ATP-dependent Clp protease adaptor ClpS [Belnapia arida]